MSAVDAKTPARRVVLLGASNVARGISVIIGTAAQIWGQPLEIFAAFGHGRSYGQPSRVFQRGLSGIVQCGLWDAIPARDPLPTAALLTDIGNDLIYERSVDEIGDWIDACLARLSALGARSLVTRLPIDNLADLSERRFLLMRKIFFPKCRLDLATVAERARALDVRVLDVAARWVQRSSPQQREWYGFDPIHIRLPHMPRVWRGAAALVGRAQTSRPRCVLRYACALYLRSVFPERRTLFGFQQHTRQPAGKLRDGSTLWFY